MTTYRTSNGDKITKAEMDRKIREAKALKIECMEYEHGYIFCEECKENNGLPIDCSHDVSVKECQESGKSELSYDVRNITMRCRKCHVKHDNNSKFV